MNNLISMLTKIKDSYDSGQIKDFLAAKQFLNMDNIFLSENFDISEIEKNINFFNDFFNSDFYRNILIEENDNSESIKMLIAFLQGTEEKINNLVTDINNEKFLNDFYFDKDKQTIEINDYVKQITLRADFFNFNYAAEFYLEIDDKKYNIIPFNYEGQYLEEIKNGEGKFPINLSDEVYFYSGTMNKISFVLNEDYNIIDKKINFNFTKSNSYSKIFVEYDPAYSSFFININKDVKKIKLIIDEKTEEIFGFNNFYIKVKR